MDNTFLKLLAGAINVNSDTATVDISADYGIITITDTTNAVILDITKGRRIADIDSLHFALEVIRINGDLIYDIVTLNKIISGVGSTDSLEFKTYFMLENISFFTHENEGVERHVTNVANRLLNNKLTLIFEKIDSRTNLPYELIKQISHNINSYSQNLSLTIVEPGAAIGEKGHMVTLDFANDKISFPLTHDVNKAEVNETNGLMQWISDINGTMFHNLKYLYAYLLKLKESRLLNTNDGLFNSIIDSINIEMKFTLDIKMVTHSDDISLFFERLYPTGFDHPDKSDYTNYDDLGDKVRLAHVSVENKYAYCFLYLTDTNERAVIGSISSNCPLLMELFNMELRESDHTRVSNGMDVEYMLIPDIDPDNFILPYFNDLPDLCVDDKGTYYLRQYRTDVTIGSGSLEFIRTI